MEEYKLDKMILLFKDCTNISKKKLIHNDATTKIDAPPGNYEAKVNGVAITLNRLQLCF